MKLQLALLILVISGSSLLAQTGGAGSAGALFLLFPTTPLSNGMGGTGVACEDSDPLAQGINPALLGVAARSGGFSFGFYPGGINIYKPISYSNYGASYGHNFSGSNSQFALGGGYLYSEIDLGVFTRTNENGQVIGVFNSKEWAHSISLGASYEYWAVFGFGLTYKNITSKLVPITTGTGIASASASAFDIGLFVKAPVLPPFELFKDVKMSGNISAGYTLSNLGGELSYKSESDPLPRSARIGYNLNIGFDVPVKSTQFRVLDMNFTGQADDLLVIRDASGWVYQSAMGDIDIWNNLITLKSSTGLTVRHGWKFELFETLLVYFGGNKFGASEDITDEFSTFGYGFKAGGLAKVLGAYTESKALNYFADHFDLVFHAGNYDNDGTSGYKYDFVYLGLAIKNFDF